MQQNLIYIFFYFNCPSLALIALIACSAQPCQIKKQHAPCCNNVQMMLQHVGIQIGGKYRQSTGTCLLAAAILVVASIFLTLICIHSLVLVQYVSLPLNVKTYHPSCKWTSTSEKHGGYAPVANHERKDLADFVCPSMFRDLSDYVYQWPYAHFGEREVWTADPPLAAQNLPPVRLCCYCFHRLAHRASYLHPINTMHQIGTNHLLAE